MYLDAGVKEQRPTGETVQFSQGHTPRLMLPAWGAKCP
jgi:hypothetical protein